MVTGMIFLFLNSVIGKKVMEKKHISHFTDASLENSFGFDENGKESFIHEIKNSEGMTLTAFDYGATVTSLKIPVGDNLVDVVLGFENRKDYIDSFSLPNAPYLGATIGRYAG